MISETYVVLGLNTFSAIMILALAALGLAIIFGLMDVVNLAHGAFFTLGGYTVWLFATELQMSFWLGLLFAPVLVGIVGLIVERLVIRHLYHRLLDTILATWGIAIVIREGIKVLAGPDSKQVSNPMGSSLDLLGVTYPIFRLFLIVLAAVVIVGAFVVIQRTTFGVRLRAVIQNDESASLLGINHSRMYSIGFSFGAAMAGLAGAAVTPIISVNPTMGLTYLVQSYLAVILGGTGQLLGSLLGSGVIAGSSNIMTYTISPVVANPLTFVIAIIIIIARPRGILRGKEV